MAAVWWLFHVAALSWFSRGAAFLPSSPSPSPPPRGGLTPPEQRGGAARLREPPLRVNNNKVVLSSSSSATATTTNPPATTKTTTGAPALLVDELLGLVEATDRGITGDGATRAKISGLIEALEASYKGADAGSDDRLYRECEVKYVGQSTSTKANAAGGQFRGRLGRLLFRTSGLYQHVLREEGPEKKYNIVAVNLLLFKVLGVLPGCALLRGAVEPETDLAVLGAQWNRTLSRNTVRASFDAPRVALGPRRAWRACHLQVGPPSVVRLDTTYLDDRIRISRGGSSGTPFVFEASGRTADADAWRFVAASPSSPRARTLGGVVALGAAAAAFFRLHALVTITLAALALKLATSTGGIVVDRRNKRHQPMAS